ncbi:MAG TPA: ALF repeat-containing protein [Acidimicrobiales bacterium]|jgi:hypothetical protein
MLSVAAPGGTSEATAGTAAVELDCSILEVRALLGIDLTGMDDDAVRAHVGKVLRLAGPRLTLAANAALDGSIQDARTFLESGWTAPYAHDLRTRVAVIMETASPEVRAEANAALDADTVEALEQFLAKEQCKPRDPSVTTTTSTTTTPSQPGTGATPPPATPVRRTPTFTG